MSRSYPSYPWYPQDALSSPSCTLMSLEAYGLYHRLLERAWVNSDNPCFLPDNERELAQLVGIDIRRFRRLWREVGEKFARSRREVSEKSERSIAEIYNPRQLKEYRKLQARSAQASEKGKLGGRPKLEAVKSEPKATAFSKKSSSSSSSSSVRKNTPTSYSSPPVSPPETNGICNRIFAHWLKQENLIRHRVLSDGARRSIRARVQSGYQEDDLSRAITRYAQLCQVGRAPGYNRWSLEQLMKRGEGAWIDRLLDPCYRGIGEPSVEEQAAEQVRRLSQ